MLYLIVEASVLVVSAIEVQVQVQRVSCRVLSYRIVVVFLFF